MCSHVDPAWYLQRKKWSGVPLLPRRHLHSYHSRGVFRIRERELKVSIDQHLACDQEACDCKLNLRNIYPERVGIDPCSCRDGFTNRIILLFPHCRQTCSSSSMDSSSSVTL